MKQRREERVGNRIRATNIVRIVVSRPGIDKGIPIPLRRGGSRTFEYPFKEMEVGDSFAVPESETRSGTVSTRVGSHNQGHRETKFNCRKLTNDAGEAYTRVWRTK